MNGEYGFNPVTANNLARKNEHEFPLDKDTFRFTKYPIENIKCVIIGIEPYSTYFTDENGNIIPQATGRSFEAKELENKKWTDKFKQASLQKVQINKPRKAHYFSGKMDSGFIYFKQ